MSALSDAQIRLVLKKDSQFFASLMFQVEWAYSAEVPTAAISVTHAKVNQEWFDALSPEEQVGLLAHEVMHLALAHQARRGKRDPSLWNVAGDYLINYLLQKQGFELPEGGVYNKDLNDKYTTEEIYELLDEDEPKYSTELSMADIDEEELTQEEAQTLETKMVQMAVLASTFAETQQAGSTPSSVAVALEKYIHPPIPWETILFQYFCEFNKDDFSMGKRNRRFKNVFVPALHSDAMGKISTYLDVSCSVTDIQFAKQHNVMIQIKSAVNPSEMEIIEFDTTIKLVRKFNSEEQINNLVFTGRGGTDLVDVAKRIATSTAEVHVIFTDGWVDLHPIERLKHKHIIWCIIDNKEFKSTTGKIIHLGE